MFILTEKSLKVLLPKAVFFNNSQVAEPLKYYLALAEPRSVFFNLFWFTAHLRLKKNLAAPLLGYNDNLGHP